VRDGEIDDILKKAAQAQPNPDPALLDKIAASIRPDIRPVRPLPPAWVLRFTLMAVCIGIAIAGAARLGFFGMHAMNNTQKLIFPALAGFILLAAVAWTAETIPGSKRHAAPWNLLGAATFTLLALFPAVFHDRHTEDFVHAGLACLIAGILHAIPIALAGWWLLRRGFAVNPTGAALAAGTLAGLGGISMLELHCPNMQLTHMLVWHTAVVPVSAAIALLLTKLVQIRRVHADAR
jgi:hypothetical protein